MEAEKIGVEMDGDAFRLKRLILIDSYRKNSVVEVMLDGHTSINGINAAGKTSLLRLIPLFYGESPNNLVLGGGVNKSFVHYYLQNSTSYIIFEYSRRGLACMAVLHASSNGEKVCYRFVDQPYAGERFLDESGEIVIGADLKKHLSKRNEFCSEQIAVLSDYRSVIQNTVSKKDLRPLAARFSFVGAGGKLGHIEKIATGMFSRVTSFRDLKRMIVSCIEDGGQNVRLESSKSAMESWVREYSAYMEVMAHAARMRSLNEAHLRHETAANQLCAVHVDFLLLKRTHETNIRSCQDKFDELDRQMEGQNNEINRTLQDLATKLGRVEGNAKQIEEQIAALDARKRAYEEEGIESLATLVDRTPQLESQLKEREKRETILLGKSEDLVTQYDKLKNDRTDRFHKFEREENNKKEPLRSKAEAEKARLAEKARTEWLAVEAEFDEQERGLQEAKDTIIEKLGGLRVSVKSPQPAEKYVEAQDQAQQRLDTALEQVQRATSNYETSETTYGNEVQAFNDINGQIQSIQEQLARERKQRERLLSLSNADPGTLLHFLRESRPGWTADIARVVPEDLLLRDDLSPSLVEEGILSLFGVSLDLTVIDAPRVADEVVLRKQIETSDQAIEHHLKCIKGKETELEAQSKRISQSKSETEQLNRLRIEAESEVKTCRSVLDSALRELEADRREAESRAVRELTEQESLHNKNKQALEGLKDARKSRHVKHEADLRRAQDEINHALKVSIEAIDKVIREEQSAHDRALGVLDRDLESKLKSDGVDTENLKRLQEDIEDLKADLNNARSGAGEVAAWKNWLKDEWGRKPTLESDCNHAKQEASRLAGEQIRVQKENERELGKLKKDRDLASQRKKEAERLLGFVNKRCHELAAWPVSPDEMAGRPGPSNSQDTLEAEMDRLLAEIKSETAKAERDVDLLKRAMWGHKDTTPYKFYEKRRQDMGPANENGSPFLWVPAMREWFDDVHRDARSLLLSQCRTFSGGVHEFHDKLTKFTSRVTTFSADLKSKMTAQIQFQKIKAISVRLSTSFDSLDGWSKIKALAEAYDEWAGIDSNELPPDDFAAAVSQVSVHLQGRHTVEVKLDDLIDIEIDIDEIGEPIKTVKDEHQLKDASSNGLSYLILCVVLVGLINKIRRNEPVNLVWALDELRDLDIGNIQALLEMLSTNRIHLVSAYPDADPDILRLFKNRYEILEGRKLASFRLPEGAAHV